MSTKETRKLNRFLLLPQATLWQHALGYFGGWVLLGLTNALMVHLLVPVPMTGHAVRLTHHAGEFGVHALFGLLSAAASVSARQHTRERTGAAALALWGIAIVAAHWLLRDDFSGLAGRMAERAGVPHLLTLWLLVAGAAAGIVVCWWGARRCGGRLWVLPVVAAAGLYYVNATVSRHDNLGAHTLLSWASALLLAPAVGAFLHRHLPPLSRRVVVVGIAVITVWGSAALLVRPSNSVLIDMAQWQPSLLPTLLSRGRIGDDDDGVEVEPLNDFFIERRGLPPIPPSEVSVLPNRRGLVLLLTVDGLRADLVADDKYEEYLPNIRRLAREGTAFTEARAPGSQTAYTLAAISTGKYFSQLYWTEYRDALWPHEDESPHVAELLGAGKVKTIIVPGAKWFASEYGVLRGFARGEYKGKGWTPASELTDRLLDEVSRYKRSSAFFFVHYLDPHSPYDSAGEKPTLFEGYLAELQMVDAEIGRVIEHLESLGIRDRTLVIVSSDHGEAFGEHNTWFHAATLYEELIRVPLVFWGSGVGQREVGTPVSLVDLGPTILDMFGVDTPAPFMGESLVPILAGETREFERPIVAETRLMRAMVFPDNYKVIWDARMRRTEAYDLNLDPGETANLSDLEDPVALQHARVLRAFFRTHTLQREGYEPPYRK